MTRTRRSTDLAPQCDVKSITRLTRLVPEAGDALERIFPHYDLRTSSKLQHHLKIYIYFYTKVQFVLTSPASLSAPSRTGWSPGGTTSLEMPPKKKSRLPSRGASTPSTDNVPPAGATPAQVDTVSKVDVENDLLNDPWTDEQQTALLKGVIRWKPVGMSTEQIFLDQ